MMLEHPDVEELVKEVTHLRAALENREIIGQAKGIIRLLNRCDSATAFEVLRRLSADTNRKLIDVAALLAECSATGTPLPADLGAAWQRAGR